MTDSLKSSYQLLSWDSNLFGYSVAKLGKNLDSEEAKVALKQLADQGVKLVYWFVDPSDTEKNNAAKQLNGQLVDEKITYTINAGLVANPNGNVHPVQSFGLKAPGAELISLALQSGAYSRFSTDEHFTHNEYKKLYTIWIEKSVQHTIAFDVLVCADEDGSIKGFITLESKNGKGSIGLFAVDENARGKSIGKTLMHEAFARFRKKGFDTVTVTTQKKNAVACRFYEKIGFVLLKTENVYHFWL